MSAGSPVTSRSTSTNGGSHTGRTWCWCASRPGRSRRRRSCRHHVRACLDHLRRAHAIVLEEAPPEILALELRESLHQLGEMAGAVYTEDLLDRIFSRFCIEK